MKKIIRFFFGTKGQRVFSFLALLMMVLVVGCKGLDVSGHQAFKRWMEPNDKIKVLCSVRMIEDLVQQIAGDSVDTLSLITGELDPHSYQMVKGDDEKLAFAEVIFFVGIGLEHGPSLHRHLEGNPKAVAVGEFLYKNYPERIYIVDDVIDPHVWTDMSLWALTVDVIVDTLSEKNPQGALEYRKKGQSLKKNLLESHKEVVDLVATVAEDRRYLVTSHDAFHYFTKAYLATDEERENGDWKKRCAAPEGLAPEARLSVTDIQDIIAHIEKYSVRTLFPESNVSRDSIRKVVAAGREKGLSLQIVEEELFGDAMGPPGTLEGTYEGMIRYNAKVVAKYLSVNEEEASIASDEWWKKYGQEDQQVLSHGKER